MQLAARSTLNVIYRARGVSKQRARAQRITRVALFSLLAISEQQRKEIMKAGKTIRVTIRRSRHLTRGTQYQIEKMTNTVNLVIGDACYHAGDWINEQEADEVTGYPRYEVTTLMSNGR